MRTRRQIESDSYLLTEANPGACVEWKEDEGVLDQVLLHPVINEPVGIKLVS